MPIVIVASCLLVIGTTVLHYEVLRLLNSMLPALKIPNRAKLLVVMFSAFAAHAAEMAIYGFVLYVLIIWLGAGTLNGATGSALENCLYFSDETYTSLGFGDISPNGPVRLLAGVEALNGLLLIGWSASFTYISMERFWGSPKA